VSTAARIGAAVAATIVLLLVLAQLLLPRIAQSVITSRIGHYGSVESVTVRAWPAVKLLWGSIDSLQVRARRLSLTPAQTAALLWEGRNAARIDVSAESVREGRLALTGVRLSKRSSSLHAEALISAASVRAALPRGLSVGLQRSEGGEVFVRASGGLFGLGASIDAVARALEGRLVARPLAAGLRRAQITLFSDPHVRVLGVAASEDGSQPPSYRLSMSATLR